MIMRKCSSQQFEFDPIKIIVGLHCGFEFRETTSVEFKSVPKDFWAFKSDFAEFNAIAILNYLGEFFFLNFFVNFFQRYLYVRTFSTILAKEGTDVFFPIFWLFFVNFFQRYLYVRTFRSILAKKGTKVFFSYFFAIFS